MVASAQGRDVSEFQGAVDWPALAKGLSFAFAKASNGPARPDPRFAANWAGMRAAGLHRGAYHELTAGDPAGQAAFFLATVRGAGLVPGDLLAVVASDYALVTGAEVRAFCDAVRSATNGQNPTLVYSDLSMLPSLAECTAYDLWIAWPSATAPASVAPWSSWRFWQWGQAAGVDADAYNGTVAELDAWIGAHASAPAPVAPSRQWTEFDMMRLPVLRQGDRDLPGEFWSVRRLQDLLRLTGGLNGITAAAGLVVDGDLGPVTGGAIRAVEEHYRRQFPQMVVDPVGQEAAGPQVWGVLLTGSPG